MRKFFLFLFVTSCMWAEQHLLLIYSTGCPHSVKVLHYLDEIGRTVPMKDVYGDPEAKSILREEGGLMQVPCLLIDHRPLYDDTDIIAWLSQHKAELPKKQ